ncbi:MAG: MarR family transcriptional regulator [Paludibacter sp.]
MPDQITEIVFYSIEKTIKAYRKFAQRRIDKAGIDITIDQWLVIKCLKDNEEITQNRLAELIFKDVASVTRMIELLVKKGYIERFFNDTDRRRFALKITAAGENILKLVSDIVLENRAIALSGLDNKKIEELQSGLNLITENCEKQTNN